ncbi:transketolase-like TK C-terminal-containing protein [Pseudomonas sp.]|uniref:transketolase-like TK C-terminal-containing protein n=1 Tax=Pseudomonas sp. TaxID=306 RepID=UPI003CC5C5D8
MVLANVILETAHMNMPHFHRTLETDQAARACMTTIRSGKIVRNEALNSPLRALREIAHLLQNDPRTAEKVWVIGESHPPGSETGQVTAWPLWFSAKSRASEKPLLYLTQSTTSAELSALVTEAAERGIFCNAIESTPSRWPKGAHPWLPLWLASNQRCLPFDPACNEEARAVLLGALHALYVEGRPGFCYLTLHDENLPRMANVPDTTAPFQGMYQVQDFADGGPRPKVHLLGAGLQLREVMAAAVLLDEYWGVQCAVWSCPSYTRLARDAAAAGRWNRLHPGAPRRTAHLHRCLPDKEVPIVAVTGYGEHIARQIGAHLSAPFCALGSDSLSAGHQPDRHWIVASGLGELARLGHIATSMAEQAVAEACRRH